MDRDLLGRRLLGRRVVRVRFLDGWIGRRHL
jgi:hypothetical protein